MFLAQLVFWVSLLLIGYTYFLYPALLLTAYLFVQLRRDLRYLIGRRARRVTDAQSESMPGVTLVVAAYNEEADLPAKLRNLQTLQYPTEKLEVIFVSDGSTDRTNEILADSEGAGFRSILLPQRRGKANALNVGVAAARNEILVFSDAATLFEPDAIRNLVRHFSRPDVGVVCGALKFIGSAESRETEGVYWKYESALRLMEARFGATLTASGALYALRKSCFVTLAESTMVDDLVIPMNARRMGFKVLYDPEVLGTEFAAESVEGEFSRRVRIAIGSFRSLGKLATIPLDWFTCVAFLSHKVLRWMVPFLLLALFASNALLWKQDSFRFALALQIACPLVGGTGKCVAAKRIRISPSS